MNSPRGGHVSTNKSSRQHKSEKIVALLDRDLKLAESDVLDLGAGAGLFSSYVKPQAKSVVAADRDISQFVPDDIEIQATEGTKLPFQDGSFDLVVYNHVIEHVGLRHEQAEALIEIRRVLRPDGCLYLAVPNRYTFIEPHYGLPFLSWLPQSIANKWVAATGKNDWYDCNPFRLGELKALLGDSGFKVDDRTVDAFYALLKIEKSHTTLGRLAAKLPRFIVKLAMPIMPTFVVVCKT